MSNDLRKSARRLIAGTLLLSTVHIPRRTVEAFALGELPSDALCERIEGGWLVHVWKNPATAEALAGHPELQHIYRLALSVGCQFIKFDDDGPQLPGLPVIPR